MDYGSMVEGRPLWAEIDLDNLEHNLTQLRSRLSASTRVCAVVKANAYGHGAVPVSMALQAAGVEVLGVARVDEGVQLRTAGITCPILLMGPVPADEIPRAVEHGLTITVDSRDAALAVSEVGARRGVRAVIHVKVDTGMHRFGVAPSDAVELAEYALRLPGVRVEGLWSHFANADEADKTFAREQFERFDAIARALPDIPVRHIANSAGIIDLPEYALDMVRPGISLLGIYPSAEVQHDLDLRPVLTLRAQITRCREVPAGDTVSYGRTWTSERASIVGTVPLGYADGYRRGLSNRASMLVRGQRVPVVGRVTMDQTMVDLTAIGALDPGTVVTIYGRDGADQVTVNEIAALEQTIPYEITCALSARVPRLAIRHGQVHSVHTLVGDHEVLRQTAR